MSITSYFNDFVSGIVASHEAKKLARQTYGEIADAIKAQKFETVDTLMTVATEETRKLMGQLKKDSLPRIAFLNGNVPIFQTVLEKSFNSDPNLSFVETEYYDRGEKKRTTEKSFLYTAIESRNADMALYLARHPGINLEKGSYVDDNDRRIWARTPIEEARESGMIQVVITLAERLAELRTRQGDEFKEKMRREADAYLYEADQLHKLNLPEGVYKLPPVTPG